jgi:hypothetical protein
MAAGNFNDETTKKRGRRKRVCLDKGDVLVTAPIENNVHVSIEEITLITASQPPPTSTSQSQSQSQPTSTSTSTSTSQSQPTSTSTSQSQPTSQKRGRKPKGGKITFNENPQNNLTPVVANIILHLKCSIKDVEDYNTQLNKIVTDPLNYNSEIPPEIMTYDSLTKQQYSSYQQNEQTTDFAYQDNLKTNQPTKSETVCSICKTVAQMETNDGLADIQVKDVNQKLKKLKIQLYKNAMPEKKSACFWCTYEYDNQPCYIPKYENDGSICGYGSFCRPECAVGFLMKENIDDSTKFERYHLLNQLYGKIYDYKNNIKPAPNPHFLLDKFYGNLSIQEYRKLLSTKHMLLVIDKPLTRILPELHEDTDDFIMGVYGGTKGGGTQAGGVYKVKRQSEKQPGPSKNSIMKGNFGLA